MWIKSIRIIEPPYKKEFTFHPGVNLIHSSENSHGKTALIRFILYGLGFDIPDLQNLKMKKCFVTLTVINDNRTLTVYRHESDLQIRENDTVYDFHISHGLTDAQAQIFNSNNKKLMDSILGSIYIDQERGWTLLNRGKVIGKNEFQIDRFLNSVSKDDIEQLIRDRQILTKELERYRQLLTLSDKQRTLEDYDKKRINLSTLESAQADLDSFRIDLKSLKKEERRIRESISDNKKFMNYIDQMKLLINVDGKEMQLTHDMIVTCPDNMDFLKARITIIETKIEKIQKLIMEKEKQLSKIIEDQDSNEILDAYSVIPISKLNIDSDKIQSSIRLMNKKLKQLSEKINTAQDKTSLITELDRIIERNARVLEIEQYLKDASNPLCKVDKLKGFSGTNYRKVILSYRLAYASIIELTNNIVVPIIIDSPSGEVDETNINDMTNLLTECYSHHQIIIASINELKSLSKDNIIELKTENRLVDKLIDEGNLNHFIDTN